jgi:hypothetical protein
VLGLLACNAVYLGVIPTFRRTIYPPYSRSNSNESKRSADADGEVSSICRLLLVYCLAYSFNLKMDVVCSSELHGVTNQNILMHRTV